MGAPHRVGNIPPLENEYSRKKRPMRPCRVPLRTAGLESTFRAETSAGQPMSRRGGTSPEEEGADLSRRASFNSATRRLLASRRSRWTARLVFECVAIAPPST